MIPITIIRCRLCGMDKPLEQYFKVRSSFGYNRTCLPCRNEVQRRRRQSCKELRDKNLAYTRAWRKANPGKTAERERARYWVNVEESRRKRRESAGKRQPSVERALHKRMSGAFRRFLATGKQGRSWSEMVDYSAAELKWSLERQFLPGMSWENMGEWHIDHIVPLCIHEGNDARKAFALTNLRPIWGKDNLVKNRFRTHLI